MSLNRRQFAAALAAGGALFSSPRAFSQNNLETRTMTQNATTTATLAGGIQMPLVGFGTWQITGDECTRCVKDAIAAGYRLIDTAQVYGNEEQVGAALRTCGVPREQLFVTTKIWFRHFEADKALASAHESLRKLGTDYVDLLLLHWPFGNTYAAWRVQEKLLKEGKARAIGVSNYAPSQLVDLMEFNEVAPAVNQIETHLLAQQKELAAVMARKGIAHQAYSPLGSGRAKEMFDTPAVKAAAAAHGKTPAQIALRYLVQRGISIIPKTTHAARMRENIAIFDFQLSAAEMQALAALDTGRPLIGLPQDGAKAEAAMRW